MTGRQLAPINLRAAARPLSHAAYYAIGTTSGFSDLRNVTECDIAAAHHIFIDDRQTSHSAANCDASFSVFLVNNYEFLIMLVTFFVFFLNPFGVSLAGEQNLGLEHVSWCRMTTVNIKLNV